MKKIEIEKKTGSQQDELQKILYDEARKVAGNDSDAKALADEAYRDFKIHHLQYC